MSNFYLWISLIGFTSMTAGIAMNWGVGWACLVGGLLLFVAGGVGSAREGR